VTSFGPISDLIRAENVTSVWGNQDPVCVVCVVIFVGTRRSCCQLEPWNNVSLDETTHQINPKGVAHARYRWVFSLFVDVEGLGLVCFCLS